MEVVGGLRLGTLGFAVSVMVVVGGWLAAGRASASGDANHLSCPVATEFSPGFRASLPDCRAYEIVSEANSGDATNVVGSYGFPEGDHVYYKSFLPTPAGGARSDVSERFLATRTSSGWVQRSISPPQGEGPSQLSLGVLTNAEGVSFTGDFSEAFVDSPFRDPFEEPQLNKTLGMGVYRLSIGSGAVSLQSLPDSGELTQSMIETPAYIGFAEANGLGAFLAGGAADGSRAFFVTTAKLATAPGTPQDTHEASDEIYERTGGHTYLVGVLPDGSVPNCGAEVGQGVLSTLASVFYSYGAVAPNGANVVFFSPGPKVLGAKNPCNEGGLFLRDVVRGTTVQLPGSVFGGRAGIGAGEEEKIFTTGGEAGAIYEYHVGSGQTTEIGVGALLAYSPDGSRVYFLGNEEGIYVYHDGETNLVPGTQAGGYRAVVFGETGGLIADGGPTEYGQTANMPAASGGVSDGSHLLFIDTAKLTGYENEGHEEAYVYNVDTETVMCVSCNPSGAAPQGQAQLMAKFMLDYGELPYQPPSPPFISEDGSRAVFETTEALVPQDTNGTTDVYEWELAGTNGCSSSSATYSVVIDGCVYLLSSGLGKEIPNNLGITDGAHLVGASENLNDVYIQTSESLLPGLDNASKLYDVRINGGFPYTPSTPGCEAEQCNTAAGESAALGESITEAFAGAGDLKSTRIQRGKERAGALRKRRLLRALSLCRKRRHKRAACERVVRRRYATKATGSKGRRRSGGSR